MSDKPSKLKIADRDFTSRLLVGTGKFASNELMRDALEASGTELVTVALRRADLSGRGDPFANILDFIDPARATPTKPSGWRAWPSPRDCLRGSSSRFIRILATFCPTRLKRLRRRRSS